MRVNKAIGEIGVKVGEQCFLLRPSFYALSQLGSPTEIVRKYKFICHYFECLTGLAKVPIGVDKLAGYGVCFEVIRACCEHDTSPLTGFMSYNEKRGFRHIQAALPFSDIVVIALHLMRYGVYGNPKPRKKQEDSAKKELTEFDPSEAVGLAVAQFGMSLDDAWNLTMVEYQRAWEGKYPEQDETKEQQRIGGDEYKQLMSWHDEVKAARAKKAARK